MWFVFQPQFHSRQKVVVEHFSIVRAGGLEPLIVMWFFNTIPALDGMDIDELVMFSSVLSEKFTGDMYI